MHIANKFMCSSAFERATITREGEIVRILYARFRIDELSNFETVLELCFIYLFHFLSGMKNGSKKYTRLIYLMSNTRNVINNTSASR